MEFNSMFKNNADESTGLLFVKTYNKWHGRIKSALSNLGITHPQFVVLSTLNYLSQFEKHITQAKISSVSEIDVMTVSQMLRTLEKNELVSRKQSPIDSRANSIEIVQKGVEIISKAVPIVESIDLEFFGTLGPELAQFKDSLRKLVK
ncbi:MarR family transcriptional regulator [Paenibacillus elgii]|uniref:MarR family transcriptional regulator n=2 Tax=Paenibacillus elgii TaxID=189691 RepID=A0A2T6G0F2_9BACL|nr:MarR family transcriptional regulator [Paenibacillus elgii]